MAWSRMYRQGFRGRTTKPPVDDGLYGSHLIPRRHPAQLGFGDAHTPSPDVRGGTTNPPAADRCPGHRSLDAACAPGIHASAGQQRRLTGYEHPLAWPASIEAGSGLPIPSRRRRRQAEPGGRERGRLRASEGQDDRSERPARGCGQPRAGLGSETGHDRDASHTPEVQV